MDKTIYKSSKKDKIYSLSKLKVGDTWNVGEWKVRVDSVELFNKNKVDLEKYKGSQFDEFIKITYSYESINGEENYELQPELTNVIDEKNISGSNYNINTLKENYKKNSNTPNKEKHIDIYALKNKSNKIKVSFMLFDENEKSHVSEFDCTINK
ncbi:hypothetical protein [Peptostreptococcus faecalis]|uniref:hypothetical protein n=1 Tax=Peptostreptococcus faecalis TaxID=2045015 RepID=UPI0011AEECEA|nr:hypothetical protein [Peptostreptococcus faecalis]